jgi:hypothetical protein
MPTRLSCTACGVEITLDEDIAVLLAEVETFSAAHSQHPDAVEVRTESATEP